MAGARRLPVPSCTIDYSQHPRVDITPFNRDDLDFAALFPVPAHRLLRKGRKKQQAPGTSDADEDDDFWLSPRMAYKLHEQACILADMVMQEFDEDGSFPYLLEIGSGLPCLPRAAEPFIKEKWWVQAYAECFNRIAARLAKGHPPSPNCTGEEMALHVIMNVAEELDSDGHFDEAIKHLPKSDMDMEYDDVNEHCVQDLDVLMLYDMRGVAFLPDANYLDPAEWFFAFLPDRAQDHLPGTAWQDPRDRPPVTAEMRERAHEEWNRICEAENAAWRAANPGPPNPLNAPWMNLLR